MKGSSETEYMQQQHYWLLWKPESRAHRPCLEVVNCCSRWSWQWREASRRNPPSTSRSQLNLLFTSMITFKTWEPVVDDKFSLASGPCTTAQTEAERSPSSHLFLSTGATVVPIRSTADCGSSAFRVARTARLRPEEHNKELKHENEDRVIFPVNERVSLSARILLGVFGRPIGR